MLVLDTGPSAMASKDFLSKLEGFWILPYRAVLCRRGREKGQGRRAIGLTYSRK